MSLPATVVTPNLHFKKQFIRGTFWSLVTEMGGNAIRLGSNLILTRLLFPEAFGLMALVNVFIQGLGMFSDVGITASIVQNRRGEERAFLDTAWTVQVVRGVLLLLGAAAIGFPAAWLFKQPQLTSLVPVVAICCAIDGLLPTKYYLLSRKVDLRASTFIELGSRTAGLVVLIGCAYFWRSVWALVIGTVAGTCFKLLFAQLGISGTKNRWFIDRAVLSELMHFGKWIFPSTALTFLVGQGDRLLLGKVLTIKELGIYSIAAGLAQMVLSAVQGISGKVLFPLYAQMAREGGADIRARCTKLRLSLLLLSCPPIVAMIVYGDLLIRLLYDARYEQAGGMLRYLAAGTVVYIINLTMSPMVLAQGNSRGALMMMVQRSILLFACMFTGWYVGGMLGLLLGLAASQVLFYPFLVARVRRYGIWNPRLDFSAVAIVAATTCFLLWLR